MRTFLLLAIGSTVALGIGVHAEANSEPAIQRSTNRPTNVSPVPPKKSAPVQPAIPKGKASEKKAGMKAAGQPQSRVREAIRPGAGLGFKPAPEVVHVTCPLAIHHVAQLDLSDPELRAWRAATVKPRLVRTELRFYGFEDDDWGAYSWQGATSIVCSYSTASDSDYYSQRLSRKIHPSGTLYQCKVKPKRSRTAECRLTSPPDS